MVRPMLDAFGLSAMDFAILGPQGYKELQNWRREHGYLLRQPADTKPSKPDQDVLPDRDDG